MKKYLLIFALLLGFVSSWGQDNVTRPRTIFDPKIVPSVTAAPKPNNTSNRSSTVVLDFEGCASAEPIGNYYNGGGGGDKGISFSSDALGLVSSAGGGSGNFGNCPSGVTVMFFQANNPIMNVPLGFTTGFSFFYASAQTGTVWVYDGIDGTGNVLATSNFTPTTNPWYSFATMGITFDGTAKSVKFGGVASQCCFDDITFGSSTPGSDPNPPSNPTSVLNPTGAICSGSGATLTAEGASSAVYWSTTACGEPYFTTGNQITVYPTTTTTYYARNYDGSLYSTGCASTTVVVNTPATIPTAASGTSTGSATANLAFSGSGGGTGTATYYWQVGTSPSVAYGTGTSGQTYGSTTNTTASASGLASSTTYYLRVYANNGLCAASGTLTSSSFRTHSTFNYNAGANGSITGTANQTVAYLANGSPVTAVPAANYHFVNWSDGSITNPRTDAGGSNINVNANFALNILAFEEQPSTTLAGVSINSAVKVKIVKTDGTTNTSATNNITLSIVNNPSIGETGVLTGTVTVAAEDGVATFSDLSIDKTGNGYTIKAVAADITSQPVSSAFNITPAAIHHFTVVGITDPVIAGTTTTPVVTAYDEFDNIRTNHTGTIHFSSDDALAEVPLDYAFVAGDNGVKSFTNGLILKSTGEKSVTVTGDSKTGSQTAITVTPADINYFTLAVNGTVTAGIPFTVTATVYDAFGNVKTNYEGQKSVNWTTTAITSSNGTARIIPANGDQTFAAGVATISGFTFFNSDQSQLTPFEGPTITITDAPSSSPGTTAPITVLNAPLANFEVVAGTEQTSGIPFSTTVTARDQYWNTCVNYEGSIRFKSSNDALVTYPVGLQSFAPAATNHGVRTFTDEIKINVMGAYWLRAADGQYAYMSGEQQNIVVGPGAFSPLATHSFLTISVPETPTVFVDPLNRVAGEYVLVTATPHDAYGNLLSVCRNISIYLNEVNTHRDGTNNTLIDIPVTNVGDGTYTALVRVTQTGTNLITASFDDGNPIVFFDQVRTVNVSPAPVDLEHTLITGNPLTMTTDEHSDITVQLKDIFDNNRTTSDGIVTLGTTLGVLTTVEDNGNGTYSSVLYGNLGAVGIAVISGSLDGTISGDIIDTESVTITEGLPALATIEITANPEVITTNQNSTISVQLKDQFGNLITTDRGTIELSSTLGALSIVVYTTGGIYQSILSGFNPGFGPAVITGTYNGGDIEDDATVTFNQGLPDLAKIEITALPTTMTSDGSSTITVQLQDIWGNLITTSRGTVTLSSDKGLLTNVTDNADGTYTATLTGDNRGFGNATITGIFTGEVTGEITDNAIVNITEGKPALAKIDISPAASNMTTDETTLISVQLKDQFGNNLTTSRGTITLSTSLTGSALTTVIDNADGTYEATLSTIVTGTATITGHLVNSTDGIDGDITDNAVVVIGEGKPALAQIEITASPISITTDETSTITIQLKDQWGNNLSTQRGDIELTAVSKGAISAATYQSAGYYTAILSGDNRGVGLTSITGVLTDVADGVTGTIVDNAEVTFTEGLPSLAISDISVDNETITTDGNSTVTIQLKDQFGNLIITDRGMVSLTSTLGLLSAVEYTTAGKYTAILTGDNRGTNGTGISAITGTFAGTGTANGVNGAFDDGASVTITEGLPALATTVITANPTTMTTDETSTITVQLKDALGNLIVNDRSTVALSTTLGVLTGGVSYTGAGIYTATLYGNNSGVGTATITGTLAGDVVGAIADNTTTVEITEGLPSLATTTITPASATMTTDESVVITVQLKDQFGNLIINNRGTVELTATIGSLTAVSYASAGTYTATLSGDTRGTNGTGTSLITGKLEGFALGLSASVIITEGLPDLITSTFGADPLTITTDETSVITVQLKDHLTNNITHSRGTVALSTNLGLLTSVSDNNNGTYTATLSANNSNTGIATISGSLEGDVTGAFTKNVQVTITEGLPNLAQITITADPTAITADETSTIIVQLKDQHGNNLTTSRGSIALSSADLTGTSISTVIDNLDGTYTATFSMIAYGTGTATISAILTGTEVSGSVINTATIEVIHGVATKLAMLTEPSSTATAGVAFAQQPVVHIQDQFGNLVTADNSTVLTAARVIGTDVLKGTLSATAVAGVATFTDLYYTKAETITLGFISSPVLTGVTSINIVVGHAPIDYFTLSSPADFVAGSARVKYTVTRWDEFANLVNTGAQTTYLYSSSTGANKKFYNAATSGSIITQLSIADGASTADFWYYDEKTGDHTITASDNSTAPDGDVNIKDGTDQITVTPALLKDFIVYGIGNPHDFGLTQSVTVEPRDTYNNRKTNYVGKITFSSTDEGAIIPGDYLFLAADNGYHTFTDAVLFSKPGSWWVTALDLNEPGKYGAQADIIVQRAINIVANDRSKVYGDVLTMGTTEFSVSQIVPGSSTYGPVAGEITGVTLISEGSEALANVGEYTIIPSDATGPYNPLYYRIVYIETGKLTVNTAPLSIIANAGQTKVYGELDPTPFTYTASGFKNSQTVAIMTGSLVRAEGEYVNTYEIGQGDLSAGLNYTITYTADDFSITAKPITILATAGQSKVYGQLDPTFAYTSNVNLAFTDVFVGALSREAGEDVATDYALEIGTLTIEDGDNFNVASNYTIAFTTEDFAITQLALAVVADAQSKTYGDLDPALTYVSSPAVGYMLPNGDVIAFTGGLSRVTGENVGDYAIGQNNLANSNYNISYTAANLTIGQLAVAVNVDAKSKTYGDVDPALTFVSIPAVGTILANLEVIGFDGALIRAAGEDVGVYAIIQNTIGNDNYTITYTGADFTIGQLSIAVTADAKSKTYGEVDPALTFESVPAVGFTLPNNEIIGFTGAIAREIGENVGVYAIGQNDLANSNYDINYTGANLTIGQLAVAVNADAKVKTYGDVDPALTFVSTPAVGFELANGHTIGFTGELSREVGETVLGSTYTILQNTVANSNYAITYTEAELAINPLQVTVVADAKAKTFGDVDPALTFVSTPANGSTLANGLAIEFNGLISRIPGETVVGSPYAIEQNSLDNSNYTITYTGANLTIGQLAVAVNAVAKSKTYGNADPALTFVSNPAVGTVLANNEVIGFTGELLRAEGESVVGSPYAIGQNTVANSNFAISYTGANLTINTRPITLTADNQSKTYGDLHNLGNTLFSITGDGMAYDEDILTVELTSLGTPVQANVGTYPIHPANAMGENFYLASNYNITYSSAGELTVGVRTLTLADFGADSKVYDGNTLATGIGFVDDRVEGDVLSFTRDAAFDTKDAGVDKTVTYTNITITGGSDMLNYVLASTTGTAYADIFAAPLMVTALDDSKLFSGNPYTGGNGVTYSGFISGEDAAVLPGTLSYGGTSQGAIEPDDYIITPGGYTPGNYVYTYVDGTLTIFGSLSVSGTFNYYNAARTPLNNVKVELWSVAPGLPGVPVAKIYPADGEPDVITNSSGQYSFADVSNGHYTVVATTLKSIAYAAYNVSDALDVFNWISNSQPLEKVRFFAGDVSLNNRIASADASRIMNNFTSFGTLGWIGRGDWTFWSAGETFSSNQNASTIMIFPEIVVENNSLTKDFYGLATGDFDLSFIPGNSKSHSESLTLNHDKVRGVKLGEVIDLPINAGMAMEIGAVSLIMNFPSDKLEIMGVYLGSDENLPLSYGINGNTLRIGWYSGDPLWLNVDENLLTVKVRVIGAIDQDELIRFELDADPLNELANGNATVIIGASLKMAEIGNSLPVCELTLANFPNPFSENTTFAYTLPSDGKVSLEITNMLGSTMKVVLDETQSAGNYTINVLTADLSPGIYTATLRISSLAETQQRSIKIICNQ